MEAIESVLKNYRFTTLDEKNREELGRIFVPLSERLAEHFSAWLLEDTYTAAFFGTEEAVSKRKKTMELWFRGVFTSKYDHRYLMGLQKVGQTHVRIGLKGHYVNASMNFIRSFCLGELEREVPDPDRRMRLIESLDKMLDMNLDVMTSSYREAELKEVFLSHRMEFWLVRWAERVLHGLNLLLMLGLVVLAAGVAVLLGSDIFHALGGPLDSGIIKALGSLLILWMMVELLHTQVEHLRGGRFHVQVFVELALVAFIRKLFIAAIDEKEPHTFGLLVGALFVLGVVFFLMAKVEPRVRR